MCAVASPPTKPTQSFLTHSLLFQLNKQKHTQQFDQYMRQYLAANPEYSKYDYPSFEEFDKDGDNSITFAEWQQYIADAESAACKSSGGSYFLSLQHIRTHPFTHSFLLPHPSYSGAGTTHVPAAAKSQGGWWAQEITPLSLQKKG